MSPSPPPQPFICSRGLFKTPLRAGLLPLTILSALPTVMRGNFFVGPPPSLHLPSCLLHFFPSFSFFLLLEKYRKGLQTILMSRLEKKVPTSYFFLGPKFFEIPVIPRILEDERGAALSDRLFCHRHRFQIAPLWFSGSRVRSSALKNRKTRNQLGREINQPSHEITARPIL